MVLEAPLAPCTGSANSSQVLKGGALLLADWEPLVVALVGEQPVSSSQQQTDWERASRWGAGGGEALDSSSDKFLPRNKLVPKVLLPFLSGVELLDFLLEQRSKLE